MRALQAVQLRLHGAVFFLHSGETPLRDKAQLMADFREALVRVVLPVQQPVLAAGGHHAVGLVGSLGDQVVNQRADVALIPPEDERLLALQLPCGVHPGDEALDGRLLVPGGAVELARAVKVRDLLGFQRGAQGGGVDAVVLNGIGRARHFCVLQPRNGAQHSQLDLFRHGGGEALQIELPGVQAHRLQKKLMPRFVREGHDLGLNAGAVTRADALDDAGIDGAAIQVLADNAVGGFVGVGQVADRAVFGRVGRLEGKGLGLRIAWLHFHPVKVHRAGQDARRRPGLEAAQRQAESRKAGRKRNRGGKAVRARGAQQLPDDGTGIQIGSGGDHNRPAGIARAGGGGDAADGREAGRPLTVLPVFRGSGGFRSRTRLTLRPRHLHGYHLGLLDAQVLLPLQRLLHHFLIAPPVGLGPQGVDGGALPLIQHAVLNAGPVRGLRHLAPQSVQLPHQVALSRAADGRVAGHVPHAVQVYGKADGVHPEAR